jgi:hypothetical protein
MKAEKTFRKATKIKLFDSLILLSKKESTNIEAPTPSRIAIASGR